MRNPRTTHIDQMDTMDILRCMQAENLAAVQAVERPLPSIAAAVDATNLFIFNKYFIKFI